MIESDFGNEGLASEQKPLTMEESFQIMGRDHGPEFEKAARLVYEELKGNKLPHGVFNVLATTKLRLQEDALMDLAAMNAQPFDSRRDSDL